MTVYHEDQCDSLGAEARQGWNEQDLIFFQYANLSNAPRLRLDQIPSHSI